jgi:hypothetical protein
MNPCSGRQHRKIFRTSLSITILLSLKEGKRTMENQDARHMCLTSQHQNSQGISMRRSSISSPSDLMDVRAMQEESAAGSQWEGLSITLRMIGQSLLSIGSQLNHHGYLISKLNTYTAMNYTLTVTVTKNKSGKYHYQVLDENGIVISERRSNRKYMACLSNGEFYFGRLDLIGKGDHGRHINYWKKVLTTGKNLSGIAVEPRIANDNLARLNSIAYLSPSMMESLSSEPIKWLPDNQTKEGGQS